MTSSSSVVPTPPLGVPAIAANASSEAYPHVQVRMLRSNDELAQSVMLQREIWGFGQGEIVPSTLLHVVEYVGGLIAGAFDARDELLGFVFGLTGIHDGELAHWSHMLGVRESARNVGVGRMLKEFQRSHMAHLGVAHVAWSFDPLQAKNAHFNINRLGAAVVRYVPDMYGTTASPLHLGMATDRLIAKLDTRPGVEMRPPMHLATEAGVPILSAYPRVGDTALSEGREPEVVLIEIPADIGAVLEQSRVVGHAWRAAVREHFQWAFARGYAVRGVHRAADGERVFYVLERLAKVG